MKTDDPQSEEEPSKTDVAAAKELPAEEKHALLAKLLGLARGELALAKYDIASDARARTRLARIPVEQIPAALEMIAAMPGGYDGQAELTDALVNRMGEKKWPGCV